MGEIEVLIIDDHTLVRAGIKSLLNDIEGIKVVAQASNGRDGLKLIEEKQPDLVLLDIAMPELNGFEVIEKAIHKFPAISIIVLSMYANEEYVLRALKAGASGYLLKDSALDELELAIKSVFKGGKYLSPTISKHIVDDYLIRVGGKKNEFEIKESPFQQLTGRQREILQLIAEGNSTKEISEKLCISVKTVETHRGRLMERLNIRDIAGLVRYAIRMGIASPEN